MAEDFVWAIDEDGKPTKCTAKPENRGKRNCKHKFHQEPGQSAEDFLKIHGAQSIFLRDEVTLSPYRMTEEEKSELREIKTMKDLEDQEMEGGYLTLTECVWNDMDKNYFCEKYDFKKADLDSILRGDTYIVFEEYPDYPYGSLIDKKTARELDEKDYVVDTGLAAMNYYSEKQGFEATRDVYVLPYYMRQGIDGEDGKIIDSDITANYKHLFQLKKNPDRAQKAYEELLTNRDKTSKNGIYARKSIAERLTGKKGIWRGDITGYTIPYAGTAVVTPTVDISYDEVNIPPSMAVDIFRPTITENLENHSFTGEQIDELFRDAKRPQSEVSNMTRTILERAMTESNVRVLMNRRPTLHQGSMMGFKPRISSNPTVGVNPLICKQFGMDFDGDTAFIIGINDSSLSSTVDQEMSPDNFKNTPRDHTEVAMKPSKDSLLGIMNILKHRK